jgi:L,D-transpeptidase catalytic domain
MPSTATQTQKQTNFKLFLTVILATLLTTLLIGAAFFTISIRAQTQKNLLNLKDQQNKVSSLNIPNKEEAVQRIKNLEKTIDSSFNPIELSSLNTKILQDIKLTKDQYISGVNNLKTELKNGVKSWQIGVSSDVNFERKAQFLNELKAMEQKIDNLSSVEEVKKYEEDLNTLQKNYQQEFDNYNKQAFLEGIESTDQELDQLVEYLTNNNLSKALDKVTKYRAEIENISQEQNLKKYTANQLEDRINNEFKPLLLEAVQSRTQNEEEKRMEEIRQEEERIRQEELENARRLLEQQSFSSSSQAKSEQSLIDQNLPIKGGKFLYVKIAEQRIYAYEDGVLVESSPIITGQRNWDTNPGTYSILTKERNRRLVGSGQGASWNVFVKYWMLFNASEEEGLHDAEWRGGVFEGVDYRSIGSRGCVNIPDDMMGWIFNWAPIGTPVVVE